MNQTHYRPRWNIIIHSQTRALVLCEQTSYFNNPVKGLTTWTSSSVKLKNTDVAGSLLTLTSSFNLR